MADFQNFVRDRAGVAAYRLAPIPAVVDVSGRDQEDYRSLIALKVLEGMERIEQLPETDSERCKWVTTLIHNKTTDCRRELQRASAKFQPTPERFEPKGPSTYSIEANLVNRDLLKRLQVALSASEWSLLIAYMEHGSVRDTWKALGERVSERVFNYQFQRLKVLCREIIQKISD